MHEQRIHFRTHRLRKYIGSEIILGHIGCVINLLAYVGGETILGHIGCVLNVSHASAHFRTHRLRTHFFKDKEVVVELRW